MSKDKQSRNSLTDLVSQFKFEDLDTQSSSTTSKTKAKVVEKKSVDTNQPVQVEPSLLDKLKPEPTSKTTRITLDLDPETYQQLSALAEYTGQSKAKLLRSLIREVAKLLQK